MTRTLLTGCVLAAALLLPASALADAYTTGFEAPGQTAGALGDGWSDLVPALDVEVVAAGGGQALRMSNAAVSGDSNQVRSPGLNEPAGETGAWGAAGPHHRSFDASFTFTGAEPTLQSGLSLHASPVDGPGNRSTTVRIRDAAGGLTVEALDPVDNGPGNAVGWPGYELIAAGLDRTAPHTLGFRIDYADGEANDVVRIAVDGAVVHTTVSWEQYYRHDPEQAVSQNKLPLADALAFNARTTWDGAAPGLAGKGFLIDDVRLAANSRPRRSATRRSSIPMPRPSSSSRSRSRPRRPRARTRRRRG